MLENLGRRNEWERGGVVQMAPARIAASAGCGPDLPRHSAAVAGKTDVLRRLSLFAGCRDEDLQPLADSSRVRRFARGQNITKGHERDACVLLLHGRAKASVPRGDLDGELIVELHEAGDLLSVVCWIAPGLDANAEVIALEPSTVLFVPARAMSKFLDQDGRTAMRFLGVLATRHARATAFALQGATLGVRERVYCRLVELASTRGRATPEGLVVSHGLTQRELGSFASASRENVNRQLNEWRERGWIELGRHTICVHDAEALSHSVSPAARALGFGVGDGRFPLRVAPKPFERG